MKKRFLAALLALTMVLALLPSAAFAEGESGIQLGTGGIGTDDEVYFGDYTTYNVPWLVLSKGTGEAFLLSKYLLGDSQFQSSGSGYYSGSTLNTLMDNLYNGTDKLFTTLEQGAIATKTNLSCVDGDNDDTRSPVVTTAHLYPLSFNEAAAQTWGTAKLRALYINRLTDAPGWWWLRSSYDDYDAFCVDGVGNLSIYHVNNFDGGRPAFNLNLNSVLFTSAAVGGKSSGAEGAGALNSNLTPSSATAWKLTLDDSANRTGFNVSTTAVSTTPAGGDVSIAYTGAEVGTDILPEYLSAMLVNSSNQVLYYGRLKKIALAADAGGTQTITIPALTAGNYTLKIFNEQYNGDYNTDYASAFNDVALTVSAPSATVGNVTVSGTANTPLNSQTATVTLTNDTFTTTSYTNCASWFTNLPTGITASATVTSGNIATITFGGTPTAASTEAMAITIPAASLTGGAAITATTNANANYNIVAPTPQTVTTPTFSPAAGTYTTTQNVTISCTTPGATIRYTIDGNDPTASSAVYSSAITVSATTTIKAKAFMSGMTDSAIASATYTIGSTPPAPSDPTITDPTQAKTVTATVGSPATFSVTATNATGYQWYIDRGNGFVAISGANAASYTTTAVTMANSGYRYYCRISNANGSVDSPIFTLNVITQPDIPATGDSATPGLWIGIMMLAGMGLTASVVLSRRKRHSN